MPTGMEPTRERRDKPWNEYKATEAKTPAQSQMLGGKRRNVVMDADRLVDTSVGAQNFVDSFRSVDYYQVSSDLNCFLNLEAMKS